MKRHLPKHCYRKGRKGYVYFERGDVLVRMPDDPASVEFARVYAQLRSGRATIPARRDEGVGDIQGRAQHPALKPITTSAPASPTGSGASIRLLRWARSLSNITR